MNRNIPLALLAALALGACTVERVSESEVGVGYTDGPIEGRKFDGVIEPGGSRTVVNDHVYKLPARQVTYVTGSNPNGEPCAECDRGAIRFTAKGGVDMLLDLSTRGFLNRREAALEPFFVEICEKHDCWTDEGWVAMLNATWGKPLQDVVVDVGLTFDPELLRYDAATKDEFATTVAEEFVAYQKRFIGRGDYFCGPGYDPDEENEDAESFCPALSSSVTEITFANPDRESVHEREELSRAEEELAVQQEATAVAQQAVARAKATVENLALIEAEAMKTCAGNPQGCNLTIIVGESGVGVSVPAG